MPDPIIKKNSAKFDTAHNIETSADIANKTAEVKNLITNEQYLPAGAVIPTGKITITENGEDINIAQYATADVNVSGGSDFSTAEVVIDNRYGDNQDNSIWIYPSFSIGNYDYYTEFEIADGTQETLSILLYNGVGYLQVPENYIVTGNATYDNDTGLYIITGDCAVGLPIYNVLINSVPSDHTLTVISSAGQFIALDDGQLEPDGIDISLDNGVTNKEVSIVVYDTSATPYIVMSADEGITPSVSGNVSFDSDEGWYFYITGNGAITLSQRQAL